MLLPRDGPLSTLANCRWAFCCIVRSSLSNMAFVIASSSVFSHGSLQCRVASTEAGQSASRKEISGITAVAGPRAILWRLPDIVSDLSRPSCEPVPSPPSAFGAPRKQAVAQPPRSGFSTTRDSLESPDGHGWWYERNGSCSKIGHLRTSFADGAKPARPCGHRFGQRIKVSGTQARKPPAH